MLEEASSVNDVEMCRKYNMQQKTAGGRMFFGYVATLLLSSVAAVESYIEESSSKMVIYEKNPNSI